MTTNTKYLDLDFINVGRQVGNNDLVSRLRGRVGCGDHFGSSSVLSCSARGCVCRATQHLGFG